MRLRSMKSFGCLSASAVAAALIIGSCLPTNSVQAQEVKTGGTLVMARPADIFTFDPVNTQDDRSIFTELTVYDRLVRLSDDGTNVEPELAVEWSVAADGSINDPIQSLYFIQQFLTEFAIVGTTYTVKKVDGSTTLFTLTLNDATTPSGLTRS